VVVAVELVMPRLSESMEEGTVVSWLVADGAQVAHGQEIAEIETDKATVPYEAPEAGILRILVPEGSTLTLGQPIGLIDDLAPLPGGQSVAPPGVGSPGTGQVPAPRAPHDEPPTASFEIQPELHEPHTVQASSPPPSGQSPDAAWSPAWGPQPAIRASRTSAEQESHDEEGETTEFEAVRLEDLPPARPPVQQAPPVAQAPEPTPAPAAAAPPAPEPSVPDAEPAAIAHAAAPELPLEHAGSDRAAVLAEGADATGPGPVPAAAQPAPAPLAGDAPPALPWVDPSFSPRPAPVGETAAIAAGAAVTPGAPIDDVQRFHADELVGPSTLPPRPPELRATPAAGQQRIAASPVARRLATELGIDLSTIEGTGPEGRVVRADIEAAQATGAARPPKQAGATPAVASEFTPPVDDDRAAAPIPAVEPTPPDEQAAPGTGASPEPTVAEPVAQVEAPAAESAPTHEQLEAEIAAEEAPDPPSEAEAEPVASPPATAATAAAPTHEELAASLAAEIEAEESPDPPAEDEVRTNPFAAPTPASAAEPVTPVDPDTAALAAAQQLELDSDPEAAALAAAADAAGPTDDAAPEPEPQLEAVPDPEPAAASADETAEDIAVESDLPPEEPAVPTPAAPTAETPTPAPSAPVPGALPGAQPGGGKGEPTVIELTRQQQTVARRMAESKATIPDFHTVMEIDAAPLALLRTELKTNRPDLVAPSVNDLVLKATAVALRAFPALNGGYRDGRLEQYPRVNVGFAVDHEGTLLVPVVHDADRLSVSQIAERTGELIGKANDGGLRPPDIASATFTVSNLGTYGVDQFTAVITPGQAAILTVGAIKARPVVRDGQLVAGQTLLLTLTTDHRAVYGAAAASFLARIRQLLEHPTSLLA
jgi:pyruvate dehydrogenase E2 component (dihydrolipoamide acetyltransferase)